MSFFLLQRTSILTYRNIDCIETQDAPCPVISNSLSHYLYDIKEKIDKHEREWDIYKKYTNPYEYIHTMVPMKKKCVATHKPLSRSYFKMIEIMNIFNLKGDSRPIRSFHLAEGPGGFIEALAHIRNCPHDTYVGMTILDEHNDPNIPGWKKTAQFLKENPNVYIEAGYDGTGNILSMSNLIGIKEKYGSAMDLITADGGFDFSLDFNSQEINITKLLFAQICFAITMQKRGGSFILKIFDCFMQHTIDLLYILSSFYERVYIMKPYTSRYANSEKYIICKGFLHTSPIAFLPHIFHIFEKAMNAENPISRFLNIPISHCFISKLEEYNAIFGQQQVENIFFTISLIENKYKQEKVLHLIKTNVQKCIAWCTKYNIAFNHLPIAVSNIFLDTKDVIATFDTKEDVEIANIIFDE
uniref:Ribosomal RNA methyltransferase FtsJ domain-containing protein n=1 Tax=viral metagenome TaxID=1070528 RepID=A0A6C0D1S7_9ZZZZ